MHILLLDGHNLLYRAFTSIPRSLTGTDGLPLNGVYGMVGAVLRLVRETGATHAVAAFDVPDVPTWRHELYSAYQGQRGPLGGEHAGDFTRQVEIARRVLPTMNVPVASAPRYEADDVMGTLAMRATRETDARATIVSTDRDLLQLVGDGIDVLVPGKELLVLGDEGAVRSRLGVSPAGVTTFKALAGDPSDNIPGVAGIGARTAANLVERYATLDDIYANLAELPARTRAALEAQRDDAYLYLRVVTVQTDLNLGIDLASLPSMQVDDADRAGDILTRAGYPRSGKGAGGTPEGIRTPDL